MSTENKREIAQEVADLVVEPIVRELTKALFNMPSAREVMGEQLTSMRKYEAFLAAFPTPETMEKAELCRVKNDLFEAIINCLDARSVVMIKTSAKKETPGEAILKAMGIS